MTRARKLFVGPRVRRLREQNGWSQGLLAERLGLSLSYVSQIENNQRPVTAPVLLKLAEVFGGDVTPFSEDASRRQLAELDCAFNDRTLCGEPVAAATLARFVEQAPELVDAFLTLYQRHGRLQEEHAQLLDRFYGEEGGAPPRGAAMRLPHEEVRDHFNRRNNYLDVLDREGEALAAGLHLTPGQRAPALRALLHERCGVEVQLMPEEQGQHWLRRLDRARRRLDVAAGLSDAQQAFQMATQYALLALREAVDDVVRDGGFAEPATQALARQGFAHYFAGAVLLPYGEFLAAAQRTRYDIERLQQRFHVGFETVCHRLSTLQRTGARGVPFYFVRLDQAGNISKRQSATAFHFAHHGGACPLWHVHEAFAQPGRILTQVLEMPDGTRFFGVARTTSRGGRGFRSRRKLFAIGLGCELTHARELVYADGIDLAEPRDVVPIGPGCRVCPRADCVQRAFPPAGKALAASDHGESLVSYRFEPD
ncbi:MAG: short-chain fatty acyl-CoA regulator family protein [Comamonadaceae bacterium]|nr:short-chain fatty acyl-CoA regulator family protein [Comamonadaceae bacterium]